MVFFSDFGKAVTDLFKTKDYVLNRSIKLKCSNATTEWTAESSFPISEGGKLTSKATYKQTDKTLGAITIESPNTKSMKIDYEAPKFVDGLKVNVICEQPKASIKCKYAEGPNAAKLCLGSSMENPKKVGLTAEVAREIQGLWVGGEIKCNTADGVTGWNAGTNYELSDSKLSMKSSLEVLDVQLHRKLEGGEVAAHYNLNYEDHAYLVSIGGKWNVDDKSSVQGFVQSDGNTYLLYKHRLSDNFTAHMGTTFFMNKTNENFNVHYKVEFKA